MSWGIEVSGTKDAVAKKVGEQLDGIAKGYDGKEEARDILACKERALALLDAMAFDEGANAVTVKASGSHSTTGSGKIFSANFTLQVVRISLAL